MAEWDILNLIADSGSVLVLSVAVLIFVSKQITSSEKRWCDMVERDLKTREDHTRALTEMTTLLQRINGNINKFL